MIEFTQYLLPNGRRRQQYIDLDEATEHKANSLRLKNIVFEVEMLRTGQISFTSRCVNDPEEESLAHEICNNGPEVIETVKKLIDRTFETAGMME